MFRFVILHRRKMSTPLLNVWSRLLRKIIVYQYLDIGIPVLIVQRLFLCDLFVVFCLAEFSYRLGYQCWYTLDYLECVLRVYYLGHLWWSFCKVFVKHFHISVFFKFIGHVIIKFSSSLKGSLLFNINFIYLVLSAILFPYDFKCSLKYLHDILSNLSQHEKILNFLVYDNLDAY